MMHRMQSWLNSLSHVRTRQIGLCMASASWAYMHMQLMVKLGQRIYDGAPGVVLAIYKVDLDVAYQEKELAYKKMCVRHPQSQVTTTPPEASQGTTFPIQEHIHTMAIYGTP